MVDLSGFKRDPGEFLMPFGKFAGESLDEIASSDSGLRWLDWAAGELEGVAGDTIREYVDDDDIQRAISDAIEEMKEWSWDDE